MIDELMGRTLIDQKDRSTPVRNHLNTTEKEYGSPQKQMNNTQMLQSKMISMRDYHQKIVPKNLSLESMR